MRRTNSLISSRERERREEALIEVMSSSSSSSTTAAATTATVASMTLASSSSMEDDQFGVHSSARSLPANNEQQQDNVRMNRRDAPRRNFSPLPVVADLNNISTPRNNDDNDIGRQESVQEDEDDKNLVSQSHSESVRETQRQRVRGTRSERNRLPRNWIQHSDDTGDVWFENVRTGVIQWDLPRFIDEEETRERNQDQESINYLTRVWIRRTDDEDEWFENAADTSLVEWVVPDGHQIISEEEFEEMQARKA
jgi:hypothetical protein